jgi:hypothetical protein
MWRRWRWRKYFDTTTRSTDREPYRNTHDCDGGEFNIPRL